MFDDEYSNQESVTVTTTSSGYTFTINFRGVRTPYGKVYSSEEQALEAGKKMLANMKVAYTRTVQATRR